jgi:hypothetical protein
VARSQWRLRADQLALVPRLTAWWTAEWVASFSFMIGLLVREADYNGSFLPKALIAWQF